MTLDFVSRSQLAQKLRDGWSLIPGHNYIRGDWAILMVAPVEIRQPSAAEIDRTIAMLSPLPRRQRVSNIKARAMGRARANGTFAKEDFSCTL